MFILNESHFGDQTIIAVAGNKKALLSLLRPAIAQVPSDSYEAIWVHGKGVAEDKINVLDLQYSDLVKWNHKEGLTLRITFYDPSDSSREWTITYFPDSMKNEQFYTVG